jgi:acyl-CoA hydrolase
MEIRVYKTYHLVKSEDLNHHGTLYAGRNAEWFVEAGFIAAAALSRPENIVCLSIHGLVFRRPVHLGEVVAFESRIVHVGRSRIMAFVEMKSGEESIVRGFITFVNVDREGRPLSHGVSVEAVSPEDRDLQEQARRIIAETKLME